MKLRRLLLSAVFVLTAVATGQAQHRWTPINTIPDQSGRYDDIKFVDSHTGWLVNTAGEIWRTDDTGNSWIRQAQTTFAYRSVAPLTRDVAFVGTVFTPGAVLVRTIDGGATWVDVTDRIFGPPPAGICGMSVVDDRTIYGVGAFHGTPRVIKTRNGGGTWSSTNVDAYAKTLIDVHFFNEQTGIIVGGTSESLEGDAVVLRTENGGDSWEVVHRTTREAGISGEWGWKISFPSARVGYVSIEYGSNTQERSAKVLKTTDGGESWEEILIPGSTTLAGLQGIGFISEDTGWASGRGVTSVTQDGGKTWRQLRAWSEGALGGELDGRVNRFVFVNDSLSFAIGQRVYRLDGFPTVTAVEPVPVPRTFDISTAYPNPFSDWTRFDLSLDRAGQVRVEVIDVMGRRLATLMEGWKESGVHRVDWNGTDGAGRLLPSGSYIILMDLDGSPETKKVVFLRR